MGPYLVNSPGVCWSRSVGCRIRRLPSLSRENTVAEIGSEFSVCSRRAAVTMISSISWANTAPARRKRNCPGARRRSRRGAGGAVRLQCAPLWATSAGGALSPVGDTHRGDPGRGLASGLAGGRPVDVRARPRRPVPVAHQPLQRGVSGAAHRRRPLYPSRAVE